MLSEGAPGSSPYLYRTLTAIVAALVLALIGYELLVAPKDDDSLAWTPPAGLTTDETPPWLRTLCADRTRTLCAAAERARNPSDCESLRAALRAVEAVERELSARGDLTSHQRFVLIELYGQGHQLCQFVRGQEPAKAK